MNINEEWLKNLEIILTEFRMYQSNNNEPYSFDLLGFMNWLDDVKGIDTINVSKDKI